jgi:hypothetical protein
MVIKSVRIQGLSTTLLMAYLKNAYRYSVENPESKRTFRRPRHGSNGNIRVDLEKVTYEAMDCIHVV